MWDKLKQIKLGKWISLLFFLAVIYTLQYCGFKLYKWLTNEQSLPLTSLILTGHKEHVPEDAVRAILIAQKDKLNFFTIEIAQIQQQIEALPWVYSASIRKRWPDTLKIHIVEQPIVAIWNDHELLNRFGEIIDADPKTALHSLVALYGEDNASNDVLETYIKIKQLLKVNNFKIASLKSDRRQSTDVGLENGIGLRLGQEQKLNRIQRFLSVYPLIEKKYDISTINYVDLRYDTGFAIGWKKKKIEVN